MDRVAAIDLSSHEVRLLLSVLYPRSIARYRFAHPLRPFDGKPPWGLEVFCLAVFLPSSSEGSSAHKLGASSEPPRRCHCTGPDPTRSSRRPASEDAVTKTEHAPADAGRPLPHPEGSQTADPLPKERAIARALAARPDRGPSATAILRFATRSPGGASPEVSFPYSAISDRSPFLVVSRGRIRVARRPRSCLLHDLSAFRVSRPLGGLLLPPPRRSVSPDKRSWGYRPPELSPLTQPRRLPATLALLTLQPRTGTGRSPSGPCSV